MGLEFGNLEAGRVAGLHRDKQTGRLGALTGWLATRRADTKWGRSIMQPRNLISFLLRGKQTIVSFVWIRDSERGEYDMKEEGKMERVSCIVARLG